MNKVQHESDNWLDALLKPQREELPSFAWNQLRIALGQLSREHLISQVASKGKTPFSNALQETLSTHFQDNQTIRNLEIQLQIILLFRAKTRNNHLASDYVRELESDLFGSLSIFVKHHKTLYYALNIKRKNSLFKCIRSQRPVVIKNFQFKARSWTVSQLLKEYGKKISSDSKR